MKKIFKIKAKWLILLSGSLLVLASYLISKFSTNAYLLDVHSEIAGVGFGFLIISLICLLLGRRVSI